MTVASTNPNPYVGPRPFRRGEALYGRDEESYELLNRVMADRFVLVYGPSGSGKTSLLRTGLLPGLEREGFQVWPNIRVGIDPGPEWSGNRYVASVLMGLEQYRPPDEHRPFSELAGLTLTAYLDAQGIGGVRGDVFMFDQFEEVLTADRFDEEARRTFLAQLRLALEQGQRWAVFAIREEFLGALEPYFPLLPEQLWSRLRVDLLTPEAAREAIVQPAAHAGVAIDEEAAERLVDDLRQVIALDRDQQVRRAVGRFVEPVQLQVVCVRLWELRSRPDKIRLDDVERVWVDPTQALAEYYAEVVARVARESGVDERVLRDWCEHNLITDGGMRATVLSGYAVTQGMPRAALELMVDAYLVRAEVRHGKVWYELNHDRMVEPIRADNRLWRERHLQPWQRAASEWVARQRPLDLLLSGPALTAAKASAPATPVEREFLELSEAIDDRQREVLRLSTELDVRRRIEFWLVVIVLGVVIMVSLLETLSSWLHRL